MRPSDVGGYGGIGRALLAALIEPDASAGVDRRRSVRHADWLVANGSSPAVTDRASGLATWQRIARRSVWTAPSSVRLRDLPHLGACRVRVIGQAFCLHSDMVIELRRRLVEN